MSLFDATHDEEAHMTAALSVAVDAKVGLRLARGANSWHKESSVVRLTPTRERAQRFSVFPTFFVFPRLKTPISNGSTGQ